MNIENRIPKIEDLPLSLTAKDIARVLGVSLEHAYKLMHRKEFPSVQIGKRLVIPKPAFEKWMKIHFIMRGINLWQRKKK